MIMGVCMDFISRRLNSFKKGFTVIEIAVVVTILALLVAVTYVGYGAWRDRVAETEVKSDLKGVYSAMEDARNFGEGYPSSMPSGFEGSEGVTLQYIYGHEDDYCIEGQSVEAASVRLYISSESGGEPQAGPCPAQALKAPTINEVAVTGTQAVVGWGSVAGATGYDVQRRIGTGAWSSVSASGLSTTITGLSASNVYQFQVRSKNSTSQSPWSDTVERVTLLTPNITSVSWLECANLDPSGTLSGQMAWLNVTLSWTASSGSFVQSYLVLEGTKTFKTGAGVNYNAEDKYVNNPGSGSLTETFSSTAWMANQSSSGSVSLYGVGPNGERSAPATSTSPVRPPHDC